MSARVALPPRPADCTTGSGCRPWQLRTPEPGAVSQTEAGQSRWWRIRMWWSRSARTGYATPSHRSRRTAISSAAARWTWPATTAHRSMPAPHRK